MISDLYHFASDYSISCQICDHIQCRLKSAWMLHMEFSRRKSTCEMSQQQQQNPLNPIDKMERKHAGESTVTVQTQEGSPN